MMCGTNTATSSDIVRLTGCSNFDELLNFEGGEFLAKLNCGLRSCLLGDTTSPLGIHF